MRNSLLSFSFFCLNLSPSDFLHLVLSVALLFPSLLTPLTVTPTLCQALCWDNTRDHTGFSQLCKVELLHLLQKSKLRLIVIISHSHYSKKLYGWDSNPGSYSSDSTPRTQPSIPSLSCPCRSFLFLRYSLYSRVLHCSLPHFFHYILCLVFSYSLLCLLPLFLYDLLYLI